MKFRKILSVLLVLLMATGTLTIGVNAESITKGTDSAGYKVYFYNEKNWASPYLYCYEGSKSNAAWPG